MKKFFIFIPLVVVFIFIGQHFAEATIIYHNDFQTAFLNGWSSTGGSVTISTSPSSHKFLGRNPDYGFSYETVSLSLSGIPVPNMGIHLAFDLYIIASWDGNSTEWGPDIFNLSVSGGPTLLNTTFSTHDYQSYPENYSTGASYEWNTGASEVGTLGYTHMPFTNAIYHLEYTFSHSNSDLIINFAGINLQQIEDESWGIDNVVISVIPEPNTILLLGSGLFGIGLFGLFKKRKS